MERWKDVGRSNYNALASAPSADLLVTSLLCYSGLMVA
jgi:hypothetical protein